MKSLNFVLGISLKEKTNWKAAGCLMGTALDSSEGTYVNTEVLLNTHTFKTTLCSKKLTGRSR